MTIGEKIRETRKSCGLSMAELGKRIGVSAAAVSRYELGQRALSLDTLELVASALGVHVLDFVCADDENGTVLVTEKELYDKLPIERQAKFWELLTTRQLGEKLIIAFEQLNPDGQQKAVERVEELTEIPRYQAGSPAQAAGDTPPPSPEGKDPTPPPPPPESP